MAYQRFIERLVFAGFCGWYNLNLERAWGPTLWHGKHLWLISWTSPNWSFHISEHNTFWKYPIHIQIQSSQEPPIPEAIPSNQAEVLLQGEVTSPRCLRYLWRPAMERTWWTPPTSSSELPPNNLSIRQICTSRHEDGLYASRFPQFFLEIVPSKYGAPDSGLDVSGEFGHFATDISWWYI